MRIYLASPYSGQNKVVQAQRYEAVCRAAASLMEQGHVVLSPVAHSHPISAYIAPENNRHAFWMRQDLPYIGRWANQVWILALDGWQSSAGIREEVYEARILGKPILVWDGNGDARPLKWGELG